MDKADLEQIETKQAAAHESPADLIASSHQHAERTPEERSLLRKCDLVMIPVISILYLVTYLVRNALLYSW